jgi:hypothetical protein
MKRKNVMRQMTICCLFLAITLSSNVAVAEDEPASVEGRVFTLWGEPMEEVKVAFYQLEGIRGTSPTERLIQETTTDGNGRYQLKGLPWGQYRVNFSSPYGKTEVWRFYLWRNAKRVLDIGMPIGYTHFLSEIKVSGNVRQPDNIPVDDATVTMVSAFNPGESQQVRTDKSGRYSFGEIQPGQYIVYAAKPDFIVTATAIDVGNGEQLISDIVLKPGRPKGPIHSK